MPSSWFFSPQHNSPCKVIETQQLWGQDVCRVWLSSQDAVVLVPRDALCDAAPPDAPTAVAHIKYVAAAAKVAQILAQNGAASPLEDVLLAPMESNVIPLPHQVEALARAVSSDKIRYLLADEVGLGKTIEAGLIIRELKLRGRAQRILIVAPAGLVTQWQMEMRTHFGEHFPILHPGPFTPYHLCYPEENVWAKHTQLICPLDAVKPLDSRKGWTQEQVDDYNRWRYADLITAGWDLVIIDEAHRLAGSTEQVARYKLGQGLAEAAPYVLLLSATPHQGKSDAFHRLMHLLDPATFAEAQNVTRESIRPFVIRTEKRRAIDDKGQPLFMPRQTLMLKVAWEERHSPQRDLYEAVTDYVREGYNLAMQENKRHLGFLMILMQRLVVSSTRAIRCTLERRLEVLAQSNADACAQADMPPGNQDFAFEFMASLSKETLDVLHDMEGQALLDALISLRESTRRNEEAQVAALLEQARRCEEAGQDAKAEALFSWLYQLQATEGDPELKCLIFTEFTATQDMLKDFLAARGFTVATLNGSMNQEERTRAQEAFRKDVRVLISTDAGGEGLNLQFCHVVINYDLPWNPMRLEQRIGRVDRIGQHKTVRAINMALEDTVEFRVREVLEEKLERILKEFGIDKSSDVLDSAQAGELFDEVFTSALLHPEKLEQTAYTTADKIRHELTELRESAAVYGMSSEPDCAVVERLRTHPLPHWLERMTINYIRAHGGVAEDSLLGWNLTWPDGRKQEHCVFSSREAHSTSRSATVLSLEDSRIRALALHLPRSAPGLPVSCVTLPGLPPGALGYWGLFEIRLQRTSGNDSALVQVPRHRSAYCALFVSEDGTLFMPTARHIWDTLQHAEPALLGRVEHEQAAEAHAILEKAAQQAGAGIFENLVQEHTLAIQRETLRGQNAFAARRRGIERVGLPEVRHHRLVLCDADEKAWQGELHAAAKAVPELRPLLLVRIGSPAAEPPLRNDEATQ